MIHIVSHALSPSLGSEVHIYQKTKDKFRQLEQDYNVINRPSEKINPTPQLNIKKNPNYSI